MTRAAWAGPAFALALSFARVPHAQAQYLDTYLPANVPGFDEQQGVTVLSRLRPGYTPTGMAIGDWLVSPVWVEGGGYNSDVNGAAGGGGSPFIETAPSVAVASHWSRDRIGASLSLDNNEFPTLPHDGYTNYVAALGGGYTIGREELTLAFSHLAEHEFGTDIGAIPSQTPISYAANDGRADYSFDFGRMTLVPSVDVSSYDFGHATLQNQPVSQNYRNRVMVNVSLTAKYDLGAQHAALLVVQGVDSHYTDPATGQASRNSRSILVLGGLDAQADGVWRYRLLAGVEGRRFQAHTYKSRLAPIVEASVIWTPTGLTTLTGTVSRTIEEPQAEGTAGYDFTNARLVVDHELRRDFLLQARLGFQSADFVQGGGTQNSFNAGIGAAWLLNRQLRLMLDYDYVRQTGGTAAATQPLDGVGLVALTSGNFSQQIVQLRLKYEL